MLEVTLSLWDWFFKLLFMFHSFLMKFHYHLDFSKNPGLCRRLSAVNVSSSFPPWEKYADAFVRNSQGFCCDVWSDRSGKCMGFCDVPRLSFGDVFWVYLVPCRRFAVSRGTPGVRWLVPLLKTENYFKFTHQGSPQTSPTLLIGTKK